MTGNSKDKIVGENSNVNPLNDLYRQTNLDIYKISLMSDENVRANDGLLVYTASYSDNESSYTEVAGQESSKTPKLSGIGFFEKIPQLKKYEGATTINFNHDSSSIENEYKKEIKKIAQYIKENPNARINIEAYTDASGDKEYNIKLANERAEQSKKELLEELAILGVKEPEYRVVINKTVYGEENLKVKTGDGVGNAENNPFIIVYLSIAVPFGSILLQRKPSC